jgi:hypothetical protein
MAQKQRLFKLKGMKFEIAELEMQVSGEDAEQQLRSALNDEFNRFLAPVTQALRPQLEAPPAPAQPVENAVNVTPEKRAVRRAPRSAANAGPAAADVALPWKPDIQKHGNPSAEWSTADKAMWLLNCFSKDHGGTAAEPKGLTITTLIATFNRHFPYTKPLVNKNVNRDFKAYSAGAGAKVTANHTMSPAVWFLTPAGIAAAEDLTKQKTVPLIATGAA